MSRYAGIIGMVFAAAAVLGIIAYTKLEIYPLKKTVEVSREARANDFLALERWLNANGRPVRKISGGSSADITGTPEKTVFIQSSVFNWDDSDMDSLVSWINGGGNLIVSLDYAPQGGGPPASFLLGFGVHVEAYPFEDEETPGGESADASGVIGAGGEIQHREDFFPAFDYRLRFKIFFPEERTGCNAGRPETFTDHDGNIKLVNIQAEEGRLTVFGYPDFMVNYNLRSETNARFAWSLFEEGSVLFIRGRRIVQSFFGKFAERGDFVPLCVSLLVLVVAGFWMVIPVFGLVRGGGKSRARPIQERFRAEIRLFKKYRSLSIYLDPYLRELRRKIPAGNLPAGKSFAAETESEIQRIESALRSGKKMSNKEIIRNLLFLEKTMERL
ncbi:MAG: hypothetical protein LBD71_00505 [Treponema sp.]|jgi:hypothetical protein|nr:hypothetical protein [Treponema sp.]